MIRVLAAEPMQPGEGVLLWVGMTMLGYPRRGVVRRYIPHYLGGPAYEVEFTEGDVPFACFKRDWVFPAPKEASGRQP